MAGAFLAQEEHGKEEDEDARDVAHPAEELDQEVRDVRTGPPAKVHHGLGRGAVGRGVEGVVREEADEDKEKETEQRDADDLFLQRVGHCVNPSIALRTSSMSRAL